MRAKLTMGTSGTNPQWNGYILSAFVSAFRPALREEAGSSVDRIMELMRQTAIYSISRETIESWVRTGRNQWNSELDRNRETMATPVSEAENGDEDDQRVWRINTELQPGPETEYPI